MAKATDFNQMQSCMERTSDCLADVAGKAAQAIVQLGNVLSEPMTGATETTDGESGMVPAPLAGKQAQFFRGDGTWADVFVVSASDPGDHVIWIQTIDEE